MTAAALDLLAQWGSPALFAVLFFAAAGAPLPATLSLVAAGAFVASDVVDPATVALWAVAGSVLGDHAGYWAGRLAGPAIERRLVNRPAWTARLGAAKTFASRHGFVGVFFTRWLFTPLGPPVNVAAGLARLPALRFAAADIAGEALWVALFLGLGALAGSNIEDIAALAGDFSWIAVGAAFTAALGWRAFRRAGEA